jgi:hypothetical protein
MSSSAGRAIYVGQNPQDTETRRLKEAEYHGTGVCPQRQLCLEARVSQPGNPIRNEHDRWHEERFVIGNVAETLSNADWAISESGLDSQVILLTPHSPVNQVEEALQLLDRVTMEGRRF